LTIRSLIRSPIRSLVSSAFGGVGGTGTVSLAGAKSTITAGAADVNLLFIGDSTGDATTEWIYRVAAGLGTRYPTHTVDYRLYNSGTDVYGSATTVSTGSGARKITFWNASISSATMGTLLGSKFAPAIGALTNLSGIIISLGQNNTAYNATPYLLRGQMVGLLEQVMLAQPGVPITIVLQNPRRDTDLMAPVVESWRYLQTLRPELGYVDVYSEFIARGKAASLYLDDVHPSNASPGSDGSSLYSDKFLAQFDAASGVDPAGSFIAWLTNRAASDILINGDFAAFASAVPDNFTLQGAGAALTKDVVTVAPGKSYSVKLVNGSGGSHLRQTLSAPQMAMLAGKKATLAVHHYISSAGAPTNGTGAVRLLAEPPASNGTPLDPKLVGMDGWRWSIICGEDVPADVSLTWAMQYANSSGGATLGTVYIDEMRLFVGEKSGS